MSAGPINERDATLYIGNLDCKVNESLLWELFLQAGIVVNVYLPRDRVTQLHHGYGFVEFLSDEDADYAAKIMNMIKLYGQPIRVSKASAHKRNLDVGAILFIGNLAQEADEKVLYDTFSAFGVILQPPKISRYPETGNSKGFAFINFASFEASDAAMDAMNGQYLCNRPISVSYAFRKESKGERHGSAAERLLAAKNPLTQADRPHQLFADAPVPPLNIMPPEPSFISVQNIDHMNQGPALPPELPSALPPPSPVLPPEPFNTAVPPPPFPAVQATQSPQLSHNFGIPPPALTQPSPLEQLPTMLSQLLQPLMMQQPTMLSQLMQPPMMQPPMMQPPMMQPPMMQPPTMQSQMMQPPPLLQPPLHERLLNNPWGPLGNSLPMPPSPQLPFQQGPFSGPYPPHGY